MDFKRKLKYLLLTCVAILQYKWARFFNSFRDIVPHLTENPTYIIKDNYI